MWQLVTHKTLFILYPVIGDCVLYSLSYLNFECFTGVVAFIEVRSNTENRFEGISKQVEMLGAMVINSFQESHCLVKVMINNMFSATVSSRSCFEESLPDAGLLL